MLSKMISGKEVEKLHLEKFKPPSGTEIERIIEEKKRNAQRTEIIEANKKEPLKVTKGEANRILLEELATLKQNIYNRLENQLMDLVFSVSHKVIGTEIKTSPEILLSMLKKGFDKINDAIEYEIKINPADYETMMNKKKEIKGMLKSPGSVKFTKDEQIERGGCQIITHQGEISSEPGQLLNIIKSELSHEPGKSG
ncbi:MAG: FliH/SctL family protein [Candidatus Aminicenantes bacterium]